MTQNPSDPPDFAALARQYLDLWEDHLTATAADPDLAGQAARVFEAMAGLGAAMGPLAEAHMAAILGRAGATDWGTHDDGNPEARPAAAAAAPDDGDRRLDELARRLDELEGRLARLEAGAGGAGDGAGRGRGKRAGGGAKSPGAGRGRSGREPG